MSKEEDFPIVVSESGLHICVDDILTSRKAMRLIRAIEKALNEYRKLTGKRNWKVKKFGDGYWISKYGATVEELKIKLSEAQQWIDSEPDWKKKYNEMYRSLERENKELKEKAKTNIEKLISFTDHHPDCRWDSQEAIENWVLREVVRVCDCGYLELIRELELMGIKRKE